MDTQKNTRYNEIELCGHYLDNILRSVVKHNQEDQCNDWKKN